MNRLATRRLGRSFDLSPLAAAALLALGALPPPALGNPSGGTVQAGQASIVQTAPNRIDIIQSSDRAVLNWQSFSVGTGEHVNFTQPSAQSATLNRVTGADPSVIMGRITANGQVFLVNPNGMLFTQGATVDVGALVATTANIGTANFMAGTLQFEAGANPGATIVNRGAITAARGGLVALVAPGVENAGVIRAQLGRVALASGQAFTLDLYGDRLVRLVIDDAALDRLTDIEGRSLRSLVANSGRIEADGGSVLLAAAAGSAVLDAAINMSGVVQARGIEQRNGEIVLHGGGGAVQLAGTLDVSGGASGPAGRIDVRGHAIDVGAGAELSASSGEAGAGGRVILVADGTAHFAGTIDARGGNAGGDGGFVEVSGKGSLTYAGRVDASAPQGQAGTLLLDPTDWIIGTSEADTLSLTLRGGTNVSLQADNLIQVNESIDGRGGSAGATLTLDAGNRIELNNDLLTNSGAITLRTGAGGLVMGNTSRATSNNGAVISAGNQTIDIQSAGSVDAQHLITSGTIGITTTGASSNVVLRRDLNGLAGAPIGALDISAGGSIEAAGADVSGLARWDAGGGITLTPSTTAAFSAGTIDLTAAGAITLGRDVVGPGNVTLTSTGSTLTMGSRSIASEGGGAVSLTSAGAMTVGDVFTSGTVRLESTAAAVDLTRDLLGASGSNGVGAVTIRSGAATTIDQAIKSTGGIDIRAGGTTAVDSRDLVIALAPTARLEANVGNAGAKQAVSLGGAKVDLNSGEVHTNGGNLAIDARNGRTFMSTTGGLFAGAGNITVQSSDRVDLTRLSLGGNLSVTSTNGAIRLDGDLGADLASGGSTTPQPVGSVTLTAGGSYAQDRVYFTDYDYTLAPGAQTPPSVTVSSPVGVRVRGINANGPVTITASQSGAEILTDGVIKANNHVTLNASTVRLRHSIFATGGDITIGGPLIIEPWGDEISFECAAICNPGAVNDQSLIITDATNNNTYGTGPIGIDAGAPGSALTLQPTYLNQSIYGTLDLTTSQLTLRAVASGGTGGGITLTGSAGRELDIRADQQYVRLDRADVTGFGEPTPVAPSYDRSSLVLVPMNDFRLNLQASNGVTFRAGSGGKFAFTGTQSTRRLPDVVGDFTSDVHEPYFRLLIASADGTPNNAAQSAVDSGGTVVTDGFSGLLTSVNGSEPPGGGNGGDQFPSTILPGAMTVRNYINPSGTEAPPGATSTIPGQFATSEISPGSTAGTGSGSAGDPGGGITLADARPITPPPPPPPPPAPPPAPAPAPGPAPAPSPAPAPAPSLDPGTPETPIASDESFFASGPDDEAAQTVADAGEDVFRVADFGRGSPNRPAPEVFRWRSIPATLASPNTPEADVEYFMLSLWDYLTKRRTRGLK